jgi:hypothetical protein
MHELCLHKIRPDKSDQNCKMPIKMPILKFGVHKLSKICFKNFYKTEKLAISLLDQEKC